MLSTLYQPRIPHNLQNEITGIRYNLAWSLRCSSIFRAAFKEDKRGNLSPAFASPLDILLHHNHFIM